MRRSIIAVLGIAILGIAVPGLAPAMAETAESETYSISIPVRPADLESEAAVHALYTRVAAAANAVCTETRLNPAARLRTLGTCQSEVLAQAIAGARIPALTRRHAALTSGVTPEQTTEIAAR